MLDAWRSAEDPPLSAVTWSLLVTSVVAVSREVAFEPASSFLRPLLLLLLLFVAGTDAEAELLDWMLAVAVATCDVVGLVGWLLDSEVVEGSTYSLRFVGGEVCFISSRLDKELIPLVASVVVVRLLVPGLRSVDCVFVKLSRSNG